MGSRLELAVICRVFWLSESRQCRYYQNRGDGLCGYGIRLLGVQEDCFRGNPVYKCNNGECVTFMYENRDEFLTDRERLEGEPNKGGMPPSSERSE
jgi:hypothetical protein